MGRSYYSQNCISSLCGYRKDFCYSLAQYDMVLHIIVAKTNTKSKSNMELKIDTPQLALKGFSGARPTKHISIEF